MISAVTGSGRAVQDWGIELYKCPYGSHWHQIFIGGAASNQLFICEGVYSGVKRWMATRPWKRHKSRNNYGLRAFCTKSIDATILAIVWHHMFWQLFWLIHTTMKGNWMSRKLKRKFHRPLALLRPERKAWDPFAVSIFADDSDCEYFEWRGQTACQCMSLQKSRRCARVCTPPKRYNIQLHVIII